jgi:hypothetical protein
MSKASRRERLKTVGVAVGIVILGVFVCMVIGFLFVSRVRTTEPYKHSVDLALQSPEVLQALGEPVTAGWLPQGTVAERDGGEADLYIQLRGSDTNATIRVSGKYIDGAWKYWAIRVDTDQGEHIDLLEP